MTKPRLNPNRLTVDFLQSNGWTAAVVEHNQRHSVRTNDLFGFIDVLAVRRGETLAVQATSASNVSSRVRKVANAEHIGAVREAEWRVEVWGWRSGETKPHRIVDVS